MRTIIVATCSLIIGYIAGYHIHTKSINNKIRYMRSVSEEIKLRNNTMVENLSKVYQMSSNDSSEFTEVDEMLLSMWID